MNEKKEQIQASPDISPSEGGSSEELEVLKREREEYLDGWKRAKAELLNYKSDEATRLKEVSRFAVEDVLRDMLVVMDSFDLGISSLNKDTESAAAKGMYMIRAQFEDCLKKRGLERLVVSVGAPFDPSIHDAVAVVESDKPSGIIVDEVERGYLLHGRLIRAARVVVSK